MSKVIADISMSLDGYVTGPGADPEHGLGIGRRGHPCLGARAATLTGRRGRAGAHLRETGAVVLGRRLFDIVDGPDGWNDDIGYGHDQDQSVAPPCFVVTHDRRKRFDSPPGSSS